MDMVLRCVTDVVRRTQGCVVSSAIKACLIPGMGVGIVAHDHIPKEMLVFQAGQDAWYPFSADCALETAQHKAPGFLAQLNQLLASNRALRDGSSFVPSALVLGVHMLMNCQRARGLHAPLMAIVSKGNLQLDELYASALPRYVDLPLYWNDKKLEELQGCEEARRVVQHGTQFYSQVHQHLFGENHFISQKAFFWAISILLSRASSGKNQPFTLIPFFDWFNHADNGDECFQEFDSQKGFTVHTTKAYEPGEQLFINYGSHDNFRLLRNYGFTTPNNVYDNVSLPLPAPLQQLSLADSAYFQKRQLLKTFISSRMDIPALKSLTIQPDGKLTLNAEHWLQVMLATQDELNQLFMLQSSNAILPLSLTHKVRSKVTELIGSRLETHSSTYEEDDAFLKANDKQMASWLRSCLHIRMGEKQTLIRAASKYA